MLVRLRLNIIDWPRWMTGDVCGVASKAKSGRLEEVQAFVVVTLAWIEYVCPR